MGVRSSHLYGAIPALAVALMAVGSALAAQDSPVPAPWSCASMAPGGSEPYGRQVDRGDDRCEGQAIEANVASGVEYLKAAWVGNASVDPRGRDLVLSWSRPTQVVDPVRIRAESLSASDLYRMDTQQWDESFNWPSRLLGTVGPEPLDLVLRAWVEVDDGRLYIPIQVSQGENPACGDLVIRLAFAEGVVEAT